MERHERIAHLERQLNAPHPDSEQLPTLLELSYLFSFHSQQQSQFYAERSLAIAESLHDKESQAQALHRLGMALHQREKGALVLRYLQDSHRIFTELHNELKAAEVSHAIGSVYIYMGELDKALELFLGNLQFFEKENNDIWIALSLAACASTYRNMSRFSDSIHYLLKVIEKEDELPSQQLLMATCFYNLATIYSMLKRWNEALPAFQRSLAIRREHGDKHGEADSLLGMGGLFADMEQWTEAQTYLQQALILQQRIGNKNSEIACLCNLVKVFLALELYPEAQEHLDQASAIVTAVKSAYMQSYVLHYRGAFYAQQRQYKKAAIWFTKALNQAAKEHNSMHQHSVAKNLAGIYEELGNVKKALHYQKMAAELKEQVMGAQQQQAMTNEHVQFAIKQQKKETEKYRRQTAQLEQEVEQKAQALTTTSLQLAQRTESLKQIKQQLRELLRSRNGKATLARHILQQVQHSTLSEQDWAAFEQHFDASHDEFLGRLLQLYPSLSRTELKICALLRVDMCSKDIARLLSLSTRTIDFHRHNIRKKIHMEGTASLSKFFAALP